MRTLTRALLAAVVLAFAAPVALPLLAQVKGGPPPGKGLRSYSGELQPKQDDTGLTPAGMAFLALLFVGTFAGLAVWFKRQSATLGLPEDETALAASTPSGAVGISPKESVFAAVSRAGGWVTPGRVAMSAGVEKDDAEDHLQSLVREGRLKAGRDKQGRVLYRAVG